ncbi:N-formylglutamate amidohydrolase [Salinimicrobium catena]|uniref:N-formylglutamate amidohydrolase n=1 Tax=Salinimicrobium catena TaxID=390640 RepID=UPI002FE4902A
MKLILTCEHAGNEVPAKYLPLFRSAGEVLGSHRGYDPGALQLFNALKELAVFANYSTISRLLVELNRSLHHPQLFSEFIKELPSEEKKEILENYYFPYRNEVEENIRGLTLSGENVLHLSIHSFTPWLHGKERNADVGLLYDPARKFEKEISRDLKAFLVKKDPELRVRFNYPYLGNADGFTTYLRKKFPKHYTGIEIEVNQKYSQKGFFDERMKKIFHKTVTELLD